MAAQEPPNVRYTHERYPTFLELLRAAYVWDETARIYFIEYAFVGTIAARLRERSEDIEINALEILVRPGTLANNAACLINIKNQQNHVFRLVDSTKQLVLSLDETRVIPLHFIETGRDNYPDEFIPPIDSPLRNPQIHGSRFPTIILTALHTQPPYNRMVRCVRSSEVLKQRLLRFNAFSTDPIIQDQNYCDLTDIVVFVDGTAHDGDPPFPPGLARMLHPIIVQWLEYAERNLVSVTPNMVSEFNRLLGFQV
jgi:hypothetical protein